MAVEGLGVASSVATLISFAESLFGGSSSTKTNVRIAAGLNGYDMNGQVGGLSGADGSVAHIITYNSQGQLLGVSNEVHVGSGDFADAGVIQENNNQANFIQVEATNDATCLAYVTATWVDSSKWGWVGDFGQPCGLKWYYSGLVAGRNKDGSGHYTQCTWLDADNSVSGNGNTAAAIKIGIDRFGDTSKTGTPASNFCGAPDFQGFSDVNGQNAYFRRAESAAAKPRPADPRLVVSSISAHNATELCAHPNSHGPDMVSLHEGVYCDMETRKVYPLCGNGVDSGCFDVDDKSVKVDSRKRSVKSFADVINWD